MAGEASAVNIYGNDSDQEQKSGKNQAGGFALSTPYTAAPQLFNPELLSCNVLPAIEMESPVCAHHHEEPVPERIIKRHRHNI